MIHEIHPSQDRLSDAGGGIFRPSGGRMWTFGADLPCLCTPCMTEEAHLDLELKSYVCFVRAACLGQIDTQVYSQDDQV